MSKKLKELDGAFLYFAAPGLRIYTQHGKNIPPELEEHYAEESGEIINAWLLSPGYYIVIAAKMAGCLTISPDGNARLGTLGKPPAWLPKDVRWRG